MQKTINCKGRLMDFSSPKVMGILNVTPDSFFDGGEYNGVETALRQAEKMLKEGADIIDIGGMSSRPGAEIISIDEELNRVVPVVKAIMAEFPETFISIDTVHAKVAREAVHIGACIVNDISGGSIDKELIPTVGQLKVPYILMHMKGKPQNMQDQTNYDDLVTNIRDFLVKKIQQLYNAEIKDIIIDPGFGFGKTIQQNYVLLKELQSFHILDYPVLVGLSRKSMIYKYLNVQPHEALNGTSVLHMIALQNGAHILRVHDVKEAKQVAKLWEILKYT